MLKRNDAQSLDEAEKLIKMEKERNDRLIGELKAAEAKNRSALGCTIFASFLRILNRNFY